jgi:DNA-directed RNA polymerase II subunit RPB1
MYREMSESHLVSPVTRVSFSVMSPEEILARSVCEVSTSFVFFNGEPVTNGLFDLRMGPTDHTKSCATCRQSLRNCTGHSGHIRLAVPVFHIHFIDTVIKVLRCVCFRCGRLLYHRDHPEIRYRTRYVRQRRWEEVSSYLMRSTGSRRCGCNNPDGCGAPQPSKVVKSVDRYPAVYVEMTWEDGKKLLLSAAEVIHILRRVPDEDYRCLGLAGRPEWLVATVLSVPPPSTRPSMKNDMGQRSEDDLTECLRNIIKYNVLVQKKVSAASAPGVDPSGSQPAPQGGGRRVPDPSDSSVQMLQFWVAALVNNKMPDMSRATQRTGRSIVSLSERLKGKEGRIRGNLMGKRVDFSARTVITPDSDISVEEVGVPVSIATVLTFPERVTADNIESLQTAVANGPDAHPGARFLQTERRTLHLKPGNGHRVTVGDIVHRHIRSGDYVMFNRQPSLHRMSMMAHRVRILPYNTFRLNTCVTKCYNADFDGDEMNCFSPISHYGMVEVAYLASVSQQFLNPRDSSPIVSVVQDVALGVDRMTRSSCSLESRTFQNLVSRSSFFSLPARGSEAAASFGPVGERGAAPPLSGRLCLSACLHPSVNVSGVNSKVYREDDPSTHEDGVVRIRDGRILGGVVGESVFGRRTSGVIHSTLNDMGGCYASATVDSAQRVVCDYLSRTGFSVGLGDVTPPPEVTAEVERVNRETVRGVSEMLRNILAGDLPESGLDTTIEDAFEKMVSDKLNGALSDTGKVVDAGVDPSSNRMLQIIKSGSKGSMINISQMMAGLGQQSVAQRRIPYGFEGRSLPHFTRFDDSAEARGFVQSSFAKGLTPEEFVFHCMTGREGLIDTAVRTSDCGYLSRKLIKNMEDCRVMYDGTVRNASGHVVQTLYGEDGVDASKVERQSLTEAEASGDPARLASEHAVVPGDPHPLLFTPGAAAEHQAFADSHEGIDFFEAHFRSVAEAGRTVASVIEMTGGRTPRSVDCPVAFDRMIDRAADASEADRAAAAAEAGGGAPPGATDLTPREVAEAARSLCRDFYPGGTGPGSAVPLMQALVHLKLSPKRMALRGVTRARFAELLARLRERFLECMVHPGEMVGILAAQSLGEPTTQLTLNSFHQAGVSAASRVVADLPRLREIINVSKSPKAISTRVVPAAGRTAEEILSELLTVTLRDVVSATSIVYEPGEYRTSLAEDKEMLEIYRLIEGASHDQPSAFPWVFRFTVDRMKLVQHGVSMSSISEAIHRFYQDTVTCVHSDDNSAALVFRMRGNDPKVLRSDGLTHVRALESAALDSVVIRGSASVTAAIVVEDPLTGERIVDTDAPSLSEVLALPFADPSRTETNNVVDVYATLGIEAARASIYRQIYDIFANKDKTVNPRHVMLLVDTMTRAGKLQSVDRHGINRSSDFSPLTKCSFEETTDMLRDAALFGEVDRMAGVSSCLMFGQVPVGGTGAVSVALDASALPRVEPPAQAARRESAGDAFDPEEALRFLFRYSRLEADASLSDTTVGIARRRITVEAE